jgi:hypothetical protein
MDLLGFHPTQAELIATSLMVLGLVLFIWKGRRVAALAK